MSQFPREYLLGSVTREQFARENPEMSSWLADLQAGDEIWRYEFTGEGSGCSGYVVLRDGAEVKMFTTIHWDNAAPHFIILWEGERPSLREIIAVRSFDSYLRDEPLHEVRKLVENAPNWDTGEAWSYMRAEFEERAKRLGLRYELRYVQ